MTNSSNFTKEQLIERVKKVTTINKRRINANPDLTGLAMDNELFAIALAALTTPDVVDAGEHFQRGYDEGHSRGLTCGKLYKTDDQMRQHRAACVSAYRAEINGGETD